MKIQVLSGLGALMIILPGFSMGVSHLDRGSWPPPADPRWVLVIMGFVLMLLARALHCRMKGD